MKSVISGVRQPSAGSRRQGHALGSARVDALADEFREDWGFRRIREKFREGVAQGERDDALRGRRAGPAGAQPGAIPAPHGDGFEDRQG